MSHEKLIDNSDDQKLDIFDILRIIKGAYKVVLFFGSIGVACSLIYLAITPKLYEAFAQISMAQVAKHINGSELIPSSINIEEPSLLIARLMSPTSFPSQVLSDCGAEDGVVLAKSIKLTVPRGVLNVVELKTFGVSPHAAHLCANSIYELIKDTQHKMLEPYIEGAKIKLADDMGRLSKAKEIVAMADKSGVVMSASYLLTRDEIRFLLDEIATLKNVISSASSGRVRLIAPIYSNKNPIAPKKAIVLGVGLTGGLFLGLLLVLWGPIWAKLKSEWRRPL